MHKTSAANAFYLIPLMSRPHSVSFSRQPDSSSELDVDGSEKPFTVLPPRSRFAHSFIVASYPEVSNHQRSLRTGGLPLQARGMACHCNRWAPNTTGRRMEFLRLCRGPRVPCASLLQRFVGQEPHTSPHPRFHTHFHGPCGRFVIVSSPWTSRATISDLYSQPFLLGPSPIHRHPPPSGGHVPRTVYIDCKDLVSLTYTRAAQMEMERTIYRAGHLNRCPNNRVCSSREYPMLYTDHDAAGLRS
jgi:hypothetical protein